MLCILGEIALGILYRFELAVCTMWSCDDSEFLIWLYFLPSNKILAVPLQNTSVKSPNISDFSQDAKGRTAVNCSDTLKSNQWQRSWQLFRKGISVAH